MPLKQITSSRVHPTRRSMKEGEWRFAMTGGRVGRLFHKYSSIVHEFWAGEPLRVDGSNRMRPKVNFRITGALASATKTITASADNIDVSGINTLFVDPAAAVVIGGFTGGVNGQELRVVVIDADQNVTLEHAEGVGDQDVYMHLSADETLDSHYGGWNLVCNGSDWYDESHARHV